MKNVNKILYVLLFVISLKAQNNKIYSKMMKYAASNKETQKQGLDILAKEEIRSEILSKCLENESLELRLFTIKLIGVQKKHIKKLLPILLQKITRKNSIKNSSECFAAINTVALVAPNSPLVINKLITALEWYEYDGQFHIFAMLLDMSNKHPKVAIPVFMNTANHPCELVRVYSVLFLGGLKAKSAVPLLVNIASTDKSVKARLYAINALSFFPDQTKIIFPVLLKCLKDSNTEIVITTLCVMKTYKQKTKAVITAIDELTNNSNPQIERTAIIALANTHSNPNIVVPMLIDYLETNYEDIAHKALLNMEPMIIPILKTYLHDKAKNKELSSKIKQIINILALKKK